MGFELPKVDIEKEFKECLSKEDNVEKANCTYELLHKVTEAQDVIQLSIPAVNQSMATSNAMINDANALILEASKWKGNVEPQVDFNYTKEKAERIKKDWDNMVNDRSMANESQQGRETIFEGLVFNFSTNKWERK